MNSGGAYYTTAVQLRERAATAFTSYPAALSVADSKPGWVGQYAEGLHPAMLILQAVSLELAASIYCLAQAVEDAK